MHATGPGRESPNKVGTLAPVLHLAAAAILTGFAIASLPRLPWRAPRTPYDLSIPIAAQAFAFLSETERYIPKGSRAAVRWEPPRPAADDPLSRMAVALWPGRDVIPTSIWGMGNPGADEQADYLALMGGRRAEPAFDLVFESNSGSVWRRKGARP